MRILSWNINGIRSVGKKGFLNWLNYDSPDILCVQEVRANEEDVPQELHNPDSYHVYWNLAEKKGYSGFAVYTKHKPISVKNDFVMSQFNSEGRGLLLEFKDFILVNLYFPQGGRFKERLSYKLNSYDNFLDFTKGFGTKPMVLCGDFNIAHNEVDLARPRDNVNNTMFTLEERDKLDTLTRKGFVDTFRIFNKKNGNYTWWPYRSLLRDRNVGWRLDYIFVSEKLKPSVQDAFILKEIRGSDHCPIGINLKNKS